MTTWGRIWFAGSFAITITAGLHAHLGDTPAEAERSYGAGREVAAHVPADLARTYVQGAYVITAEFIDGRVRRISYRKPSGFADDEIDRLLVDNAGDHVWTPASARLNPNANRTGFKSWMRSDRGGATMSSNADGSCVVVFTDSVFLRANLRALANAPAVAPPDTSAPKPTAPVAETGAGAVPSRGSVAGVTGAVLIGLGVVGSLLTLVHDAGRLRLERVHPQFAPKRVAPEVHFLAAVLAGIGAGLVWGFGIGLAWFVGHLFAGILLVPALLRLLQWKRS